MKRQVLLVHYYGDKEITDLVVAKLGAIMAANMDNNFRIVLYNEQDVAKMLITDVVEKPIVTTSTIPEGLQKAVDYIQGRVGIPENTNSKTGESIYVEKLYRKFVELLDQNCSKVSKQLYRTALENVLKYTKTNDKRLTAYLRDRGFTKRIVETFAIQYDSLNSFM